MCRCFPRVGVLIALLTAIILAQASTAYARRPRAPQVAARMDTPRLRIEIPRVDTDGAPDLVGSVSLRRSYGHVLDTVESKLRAERPAVVVGLEDLGQVKQLAEAAQPAPRVPGARRARVTLESDGRLSVTFADSGRLEVFQVKASGGGAPTKAEVDAMMEELPSFLLGQAERPSAVLYEDGRFFAAVAGQRIPFTSPDLGRLERGRGDTRGG